SRLRRPEPRDARRGALRVGGALRRRPPAHHGWQARGELPCLRRRLQLHRRRPAEEGEGPLGRRAEPPPPGEAPAQRREPPPPRHPEAARRGGEAPPPRPSTRPHAPFDPWLFARRPRSGSAGGAARPAPRKRYFFTISSSSTSKTSGAPGPICGGRPASP